MPRGNPMAYFGTDKPEKTPPSETDTGPGSGATPPDAAAGPLDPGPEAAAPSEGLMDPSGAEGAGAGSGSIIDTIVSTLGVSPAEVGDLPLREVFNILQDIAPDRQDLISALGDIGPEVDPAAAEGAAVPEPEAMTFEPDRQR